MKGSKKTSTILIIVGAISCMLAGCGKREVHEKIWIDRSEETSIIESVNSQAEESAKTSALESVKEDIKVLDESSAKEAGDSQSVDSIIDESSQVQHMDSAVSENIDSSEHKNSVAESQEGVISVQEKPIESDSIETDSIQQQPIESVAGEAESIAEQPTESAPEEIAEIQEQNVFAIVAGKRFGHSSGHGAWGVGIEVAEDGSFNGEYHDTNMGESGEGYPHGTIRQCKFYGKFNNVSKIDEYTYTCELEYLYNEVPEGTEEIVDLVRHIYTGAYGMEGGSNFLILLPGKPRSELTPGMLNWYGNTTGEGQDPSGVITRYCIYNVEGGYLFISSRID